MSPVNPGLDLWEGRFVPDQLGRHPFRIRAWIDEAATWRDALDRKVAAGVDEPADHEHAPESRFAAADATTSAAVDVVVDSERVLFSTWYELFPRSLGHGTLADVTAAIDDLAELGIDVLYLPPVHPIGSSFRKGPNNRTPARAGDPGSPWAIGSAEGGHTGVHPDLGTLADLDALVARRRRARHRHGPRPGVPVLARPPVGQRAPRVVPPSARRHDPVRGEPAEALSGHLPARLRVPGLARAVGRATRGHLVLVRPRHPCLPGRQPPHEAVRVLGVADRGGAGAPSRDDLPGRGVHPTGRHAPPGPDRVRPELHLLHLEGVEATSWPSTSPSSARPRASTSCGRTSGPPPPTSCRGTSSTPRSRRSRPAARARRHVVAELRGLRPRLRRSATTPPPATARRSTSTPRSTRSASGISTPDPTSGP